VSGSRASGGSRAAEPGKVELPPGVAEKAKAVRITHTFDVRPGPWGDARALHAIAGAPRLAETAIFDPRSRTLVLTDLCFNLRRVDGWFARVNLQLLDAYGKFGPSWLMRNVYLGDRAALRRSIDHLLGWDFDRVIVTHGDVVTTGGREAFRDAWAYLR
jgi:hypothetical protein